MFACWRRGLRHDCKLESAFLVGIQNGKQRLIGSNFHRGLGCEPFHLEDELWVKVIYDFAAAHRRARIDRGHLLRSLTPLYMARVASFVIETAELGPEDVDEKIEGLCRAYEEAKPYLIANWTGKTPPESAAPPAEEKAKMREVHHD